MNAWPNTHDRYSRHVRRAELCVGPQAPTHRLAFMIEEALRLAALPGEDQGRSYYFRHLRIAGLPADGNRRIWLEKFQRALSEQAVLAIHGAEARAASASAVFFLGEQEALEILLHRVLARRAAGEWFWPMVMAESGAAHAAPAPRANDAPAVSIVEIIEKLRDRPASWVAVAVALFAAPRFDVVRLLQAIPPVQVESWLRELPGPRSLATRPVAHIPPAVLPAVREALRSFGRNNARTLWLATLAILFDSPSQLAAGTAVWAAQSALEEMAYEVEIVAPEHVAAPVRTSLDSPPLMESVAGEVVLPASVVPETLSQTRAVPPAYSLPAAGAQPSADVAEPSPAEAHAPPSPSAPHGNREISADAALEALTKIATPAPSLPQRASTGWQSTGEPTHAAGFFFLLNALERLGIVEALAASLAAAVPSFLPRLLMRLATHARIAPDDPIMLWLQSLPFTPDSNEPTACDPSCWPTNLRPSRPAASLDYLVRVWYLAVRRWCWRAAKISVRDIVTRHGVFSVNRTDLDISLPLDDADICVRRVGLDLDPGWLPWFGYVVRFHYLFRGEFYV